MSVISDILASGLAALATNAGTDCGYRTAESGDFTALTGFLLIQDRVPEPTHDEDTGTEQQVHSATLKGPLTPALAVGYQVKDNTTGLTFAVRSVKTENQQIARLALIDVTEFGPDRQGA